MGFRRRIMIEQVASWAQLWFPSWMYKENTLLRCSSESRAVTRQVYLQLLGSVAGCYSGKPLCCKWVWVQCEWYQMALFLDIRASSPLCTVGYVCPTPFDLAFPSDMPPCIFSMTVHTALISLHISAHAHMHTCTVSIADDAVWCPFHLLIEWVYCLKVPIPLDNKNCCSKDSVSALTTEGSEPKSKYPGVFTFPHPIGTLSPPKIANLQSCTQQQ